MRKGAKSFSSVVLVVLLGVTSVHGTASARPADKKRGNGATFQFTAPYQSSYSRIVDTDGATPQGSAVAEESTGRVALHLKKDCPTLVCDETEIGHVAVGSVYDRLGNSEPQATKAVAKIQIDSAAASTLGVPGHRETSLSVWIRAHSATGVQSCERVLIKGSDPSALTGHTITLQCSFTVGSEATVEAGLWGYVPELDGDGTPETLDVEGRVLSIGVGPQY